MSVVLFFLCGVVNMDSSKTLFSDTFAVKIKGEVVVNFSKNYNWQNKWNLKQRKYTRNQKQEI